MAATNVGQPILAAAAFLAALVCAVVEARLKAGCSHDWLPHKRVWRRIDV